MFYPSYHFVHNIFWIILDDIFFTEFFAYFKKLPLKQRGIKTKQFLFDIFAMRVIEKWGGNRHYKEKVQKHASIWSGVSKHPNMISMKLEFWFFFQYLIFFFQPENVVFDDA